MSKAKIALISEGSDLNLHFIQQVLSHRGISAIHIDPTVRCRNFDLDIRTDSNGLGEHCIVDSSGAHHDLESVQSIWSRGATYFGGRRTDPATSQNLVHYESIYAYEYAWWRLRDRLWINPILDCRAAQNRLVQTRVAADCGIRVPRQIVSTLGESVHGFASSGERKIIKCISQGSYQESGPSTFRTEYFSADESMPNLTGSLSAPVLLQDFVEKDHELRVVVVGELVYAAAIDSADHDNTSVDSRSWSGTGLTYYRVNLESSEASQMVEINRRLGLYYSSMDFVRTCDGDLVFLEANPAGQWSFIEMHTGYPITEKIVDALVGDP